jgi:hypothetical protein
VEPPLPSSFPLAASPAPRPVDKVQHSACRYRASRMQAFVGCRSCGFAGSLRIALGLCGVTRSLTFRRRLLP